MFAKFDEIPSMILQDIKETKRYGHTVGRTDNVKTVYPPTNTVCGGYNQPACGQTDQSLYFVNINLDILMSTPAFIHYNKSFVTPKKTRF